jgi:hypothetical protein
MAKRPYKPRRGKGLPGKPSGGAPKAKSPDAGVTLRQLSNGAWAFVHPRDARDRAEDLEEVSAMIEAGELEIATDELRWLLSGCSEFMAAHVLLGELAVETGNDIPLARGHFGFAYQLGQKALARQKCHGPLPGAQPANVAYYAAARGLAYCLEKQGQAAMANEIALAVKQLDPTDPAGVTALLDELRSGGAPTFNLS